MSASTGVQHPACNPIAKQRVPKENPLLGITNEIIMTIYAKTADPAALLKSIKKLIDEKKIETWAYDSAGDFYHTPTQWNRKAWLRPSVGFGTLEFRLIRRNDEDLTKTVYGVYHGRFIEMLLTHFDETCDSVEASAVQPSYSI
ncbi:hypothetical protein [Burkholderia gladioli]|uniref:hypothetical protein n=2 Tax=Burkholderiaceae TaxID=119060 RepID=UPI00265B16B6|nr:hypothetical protein [Burkholderia gladioli]